MFIDPHTKIWEGERSMARLGRKDRGLLSKLRDGKTVWFVRLYHLGRESRFGSFPTKTAAREFYEKAKREQKEGLFFPERYQRGSHVMIEELLARHAETTTVKNKATERYYMGWWVERLKGLRLNHVTPAMIEDAQRDLLANQYAPQTVVHYLKALRHLERAMGFEPTTTCLGSKDSTTELRPPLAGEEETNPTPEPLLSQGKSRQPASATYTVYSATANLRRPTRI
jgi:hypothetical protein